jgi:hypothetical protein
MQRNIYIALFVIILLIACLGGFLGGRVLLQRLQSDFTAREEAATAGSDRTRSADLPAC